MTRAFVLTPALLLAAGAFAACTSRAPEPNGLDEDPGASSPDSSGEAGAETVDAERYAVEVAVYPTTTPEACGGGALDPRPNEVAVYLSCLPAGEVVLHAAPAYTVPVGPGEDLPEAALRGLFSGPPSEMEGAFRSGYGARTASLSPVVRIDGGVAVVDLPRSALGIEPRLFVYESDMPELVSTLGQFDGVERVLVLIGGVPYPQAYGDG